MNDNRKITPFHLYFVLLQTQLGIGIVTMQQAILAPAGKSGWMSILIGGLVAQLVIFIIWGTIKKFPNLSTSEVFTKLVGRGIGKFINIIYAVFFFVVVVISLYWMGDVMNFWILPKTPFWLIVLVGAMLLLYTSRNDLRSHVSMFGISTVLLPVLILFFCQAFNASDARYLMPITEVSANGILQGVFVAFFMLLGFETLLFYMAETKYETPSNVLKVATFANLTATLIYTFLMVVTLVSFSSNELVLFNQPIVYLARTFRIGISDHYEVIFLGMWLWLVFTSMMSYSFLLTRRIQNIFNDRISISKIVSYTVALLFFVTIGINSSVKIMQFQTFAIWWGLIAVVAIPLLLFVISLFKKKGAEQS